ncbi:hypothetical protein BpHYR1_030251 [Brachionus plicatilis]|uniref:Uncharacterized protein n=1 Tax=Brachionus plicatilis TaxID=10195 RepID=A0A3M7PIU0_BRAPC|nr:hypothetical protein BpHYR1_030251 [Brachionus plicatilis]
MMAHSNPKDSDLKIIGFCEVQYKRTEQSFKINSVNAEWCNIQSCINCKNRMKNILGELCFITFKKI